MDFEQAILAHSRWKTRLKNYINGLEHIDVDNLAKDDQCELGKWLAGEARQYATLPAFADLRARHTKFHAVAATVARSASSCSTEKALELLDPFKSEYGRASSNCINALTALKAAVAR